SLGSRSPDHDRGGHAAGGALRARGNAAIRSGAGGGGRGRRAQLLGNRARRGGSARRRRDRLVPVRRASLPVESRSARRPPGRRARPGGGAHARSVGRGVAPAGGGGDDGLWLAAPSPRGRPRSPPSSSPPAA